MKPRRTSQRGLARTEAKKAGAVRRTVCASLRTLAVRLDADPTLLRHPEFRAPLDALRRVLSPAAVITQQEVTP